MPVPRLIDAETYLRVWNEGRDARTDPAHTGGNPYDKEEEAGEWRAWRNGWQTPPGEFLEDY
jgi:hypothetical protein